VSALVTSLDSTVLALRLREFAGEERNVQVDFLLHLDEFDRRRAFVEAGHPSLWSYCLEVLHLREGAAGRRIQAMRVLRRFPGLEGALRDGRLCLSTIGLLGQVLTEENQEELLARAAYRTKADVDHLVASVQARTAPRAGVRKLPEREPGMTSAPLPLAPVEARPEAVDEPVRAPAPEASNVDRASARGLPSPESTCGQPKRPPEMRAVSESQWSLRVTIDRACNEDLETLKSLLAHKIPDGDLAAVLHEAIRCGIEKHGKRKGAVAPARKANRAAPSADRTKATATIPAEVRREVWRRDGGRCAFVAADGRRCNSRWKLEIDHIQPTALGGSSTVDDLRLACRAHNLLFAERAFGREHMDRFRRERGESRPRSPDAGAPTAAGVVMRRSRKSDVVVYPCG
jgi:5-methylcytosine-specific restriction endonuclease McrA